MQITFNGSQFEPAVVDDDAYGEGIMRLTIGKFASWLKTKQMHDIVGKNRDWKACPIARFYWEKSGHEITIFKRDWELIVDRGDGGRRAPRWVSKFIFMVDAEDGRLISAGRALELLAERYPLDTYTY